MTCRQRFYALENLFFRKEVQLLKKASQLHLLGRPHFFLQDTWFCDHFKEPSININTDDFNNDLVYSATFGDANPWVDSSWTMKHYLTDLPTFYFALPLKEVFFNNKDDCTQVNIWKKLKVRFNPSFGLLSVFLFFSHHLQGLGLLGNLENASIPRFLHKVCNFHRLGHFNAFAIRKIVGKNWWGF